MKKVISIICLLAIILSLTATASEGNKMDEKKYGLHVEEDGTITLEGEPFYGYGVNYFGAFARYVESESQSTKEYEAGLAGLASYNIPFIRIPLCSYYPSYYELFDKDPDRVFSYLDKVLDECAENKLGVIGSLMWWDAVVPAHVGEKRSDIGVLGSKTLEYAKNYTKAKDTRIIRLYGAGIYETNIISTRICAIRNSKSGFGRRAYPVCRLKT